MVRKEREKGGGFDLDLWWRRRAPNHEIEIAGGGGGG